MIPLIKRFLSVLLNDEVAARRWLRAGLFTWMGSGMGFANDISELFNSPGAVKGIKMSALIAGIIGSAINLGEKNKENSNV